MSQILPDLVRELLPARGDLLSNGKKKARTSPSVESELLSVEMKRKLWVCVCSALGQRSEGEGQCQVLSGCQ